MTIVCFGQEFEVVSIKPNKAGGNSTSSNTTRGRMTMVNLSLRNLVTRAYGMKDYQIVGPDWMGSERFDISAKLPGDLPKGREAYASAFQSMMQKMLADRFKLTTHHDTKTFAVYALVVGKSGIKFKPTQSDQASSSSNNTHYTGTGISMDGFAAFLSSNTDLPVIDATGLKGGYDLKLDWINERQNQAKTESETQIGQVLPDAIQDQLGLKFEHRKAPVDVLVVDHAEKVPTEN